MAKSQIILVTGSNRGIGFSIVQATAFRNPSFNYILACRSASSGKTAIAELKKLGVTATLDVVELDVTKDSTIISAKEYVEKKYGRLDGSVPLSPGFHVYVEYLLMLDQCS
jgi:NAD(P)-dependent dehydrogenase (short-subunit alcohol dehydrogenase family)